MKTKSTTKQRVRSQVRPRGREERRAYKLPWSLLRWKQNLQLGTTGGRRGEKLTVYSLIWHYNLGHLIWAYSVGYHTTVWGIWSGPTVLAITLQSGASDLGLQCWLSHYSLGHLIWAYSVGYHTTVWGIWSGPTVLAITLQSGASDLGLQCWGKHW